MRNPPLPEFRVPGRRVPAPGLPRRFQYVGGVIAQTTTVSPGPGLR